MRRAGGWFHVKKRSHLRCKCPMISSCIGKCRCESFSPSLSSSIDWLTDWVKTRLLRLSRECVKWEKQFKTISSRHAVTILNFATIKKTIKHNYRRRAQLDAAAPIESVPSRERSVSSTNITVARSHQHRNSILHTSTKRPTCTVFRLLLGPYGTYGVRFCGEIWDQKWRI